MKFHFWNAWFHFKEPFSDVVSGIAGYVLFPFYSWLVACVWTYFNPDHPGWDVTYTMAYIAFTEILFFTFLRLGIFSVASGDFSLTLARPRNWLGLYFSSLMGKTLGSRLIYMAISFVFLFASGFSPLELSGAMFRFLMLTPILAIWAVLLQLIFAAAQVYYEQTQYFVLPVSKIFMACGGVFGPLHFVSEPWQSLMIAMPFSDLFFQPAFFALKGEFYRLSVTDWVLRMGIQIFILAILNFWFFSRARRYHQAWGG